MSLIPIRIDHGLVARLCESAIDELEGVVLVRRGQPMPDDPAPERGGDPEPGDPPAPIRDCIIARIMGCTYQHMDRTSSSDDDTAEMALLFEVTCPPVETERSAYALESAVARLVAALDERGLSDEQSGHIVELGRPVVDVQYDAGMLHQLVGATVTVQGIVRRGGTQAGDELEDHHVG